MKPEIFPILPAAESLNDGVAKELMQCILEGITYEVKELQTSSVYHLSSSLFFSFNAYCGILLINEYEALFAYLNNSNITISNPFFPTLTTPQAFMARLVSQRVDQISYTPNT
jgi:hypothetical protein